MSRVKLSVVVPTLGRDTSLIRVINALQAQDLPNLEVLIIDQNPDGPIRDRLDRESLTGVRHIRLEEPNASLARNIGWAKAAGECVLFLDDDLVPESDFCRRGLESLKGKGRSGCLVPLVVSEAGEAAAVRRNRPNRRPEAHSDRRYWRLAQANSSALFFETDIFRRTGGFDEGLFRFARGGEDQELFMRMESRKLEAWLDLDLKVFHDDRQPGGCELRTAPYWVSRDKCVRSWCYRARCHSAQSPRLSTGQSIRLARSAFLNHRLVTGSPSATFRNIALLRTALRDSLHALQSGGTPPSVKQVDHLARHLIEPEEAPEALAVRAGEA